MMTSPPTVILAVLGWLLATAGVAEDDRGLRRVPIRDPQGQEVGWYEGSYALLMASATTPPAGPTWRACRVN